MLDRISPGPGAAPRTTDAAVSSQLVSIPRMVRGLPGMGRSFTPKRPCGKGADVMHVLVTRPLEDGAEIAARLAEMGHRALLAPLLTPHFPDGPQPEFQDVQAVLVTSANGVRALIRRTARRDLPIFAVGPQT